ncbi:coiled-coil domain-containing protein 50 isoform X2 [Pseudophryne corroboree]|uniref:coiled-coil domain-containing protein 50 isoform X2 n=1 Tax=Pseudophryne corroboree TaxID=495146 RepID=UPI003081D95F
MPRLCSAGRSQSCTHLAGAGEELLDGEIAQEIQDKLVIEAEQRRRQEEKDEDIARVLQEREEKRRKKYTSRSPEEPHEGHHRDRPKEHVSEYDRHHRHERPERNRKERGVPRSELSPHYDDDRKRGRSAEPRSVSRDDHSDLHRHETPVNRNPAKSNKPQRPPEPRTHRHKNLDDHNTNEAAYSENLPRRGRSHSHDLDSKHSGRPDHQDSSHLSANKRGTRFEYENERHRRRTPSPHDERLYKDPGHHSKGPKDVPQTKLTAGSRTRDKYDAEIARRLQEEELRVNAVDYRAAQMAQDEEIARWLMEREEKSHKKSKGRDKMSDGRRTDELELNTREHVRPRSRDEHHSSRSDKPYRPLPPPPDEENDNDCDHDYTNRVSHNSPRSSSKSQSSHKGSHYKQ